MNTVIVDYSDRYYPEVEKRAIPVTRSGKFVQIRNDETEYLVFSPKEMTSYHAGIMELFCEERGIAGAYEGEDKRYNVFDPQWVVIGGGKFEIDTEKKTLRLYDNSMAYGRFKVTGLKERIRRSREMAGYEVRIE